MTRPLLVVASWLLRYAQELLRQANEWLHTLPPDGKAAVARLNSPTPAFHIPLNTFMTLPVGIQQIIVNNRKWVEAQNQHDPEFFARSAQGQQPRYLFIGCSDSRVPASGITGTGPGEMFVHRNIANLVVHTDLNLLSVLQYAVEVLEVQDILVVGHYGCGGLAAAASSQQYGLIDNWLTNIRDVVRLHEAELQALADETQRLRRLVELNVQEQVRNLAKTSIMQNARRGDHPPRLHGLVYDIADGVLKVLDGSGDGGLGNLERIYATRPALSAA